MLRAQYPRDLQQHMVVLNKELSTGQSAVMQDANYLAHYETQQMYWLPQGLHADL